MSVNGGDGELNKLSREAFRSRVLNLDTAQGGKAYPRGWLAQQLGIDRKTLRKYLRVYDVGWPPFANRQIPEALHMVFTVAENGTLTYVSDYTCGKAGESQNCVTASPQFPTRVVLHRCRGGHPASLCRGPLAWPRRRYFL